MAARCAVIVAGTGGVEEVFTPEVDAIRVPPSDPGALARGIVRLVRDPELRRRLGERATESANRFARPVATAKITDVYKNLMRERP